ncbi:hypothetical protein C8F01DRAFT_1310538 [Mycena amicta]|nr:hypothetical protein C8F01DRAFT_1310538 [Mycena amicta]
MNKPLLSIALSMPAWATGTLLKALKSRGYKSRWRSNGRATHPTTTSAMSRLYQIYPPGPAAPRQAPTPGGPTRVNIPLIPYHSQQSRSLLPPHPSIVFDYIDDRIGGQGQGVWMRDLRGQARDSIPIRGAADVLPQAIERINFRIIWPGYEHVEDAVYIKLENTANVRLTRAELGKRVADRFMQFLEKVKDISPTATRFPVNDRGVKYEHLYLLKLVNTTGNVWQADIALDTRSPQVN